MRSRRKLFISVILVAMFSTSLIVGCGNKSETQGGKITGLDKDPNGRPAPAGSTQSNSANRPK